MLVGSRDSTAALLALTLTVSAYTLATSVGVIPTAFATAFVSVFIWANRSVVDVPTQNPLDS